VVWDAVRKPFGQRTVEVAEGAVLLGFPGQYYDEETNNYYNYYRDYDPISGRYLQSDPIGLDGGLNTYGYVGENPIRYSDPKGLFNVTASEVWNGSGYEWVYEFSFRSCKIALLEKISNRFIPRTVKGGAGILGRMFPGQAGDVDISDISQRCKCQEYDPMLETYFENSFGSTNKHYGQASAKAAIDGMRNKLKPEDDCDVCVESYNSNDILRNARARGTDALRRHFQK
jgi:RHS repeat-associated protein